ncbi:MAG: hypothetical protein AAF443_00470 [Chlamydiota bacterium]
MADFPFPINPLSSGKVLQASKWLTFRFLVEESELAALMQACQPLLIGNVSECVARETAALKKEDFLNCYCDYIADLRAGKVPQRSSLRPFFSAAWTVAPEALAAVAAPHGQWLIKPVLPVVQLSAHFFSLSVADGRLFSGTYGSEQIPWGLQFAYPQMYALSDQGEIHFSNKEPGLPNHGMMKTVKIWVRNHTRPARFCFQEKKITATFRISQAAAKWMAQHPSLKQVGLELQK